VALTDQERLDAIDELEQSFKDYVQLERDRITAERDFLSTVLETRVGGVQELRGLIKDQAGVFAYHEINTFLAEAENG